MYLVWTVLGLCCCEGFSLVVVSGGYSLVVVSGGYSLVAVSGGYSLVAGPRVPIAVVSLAANDRP